MKKAEQLVCRPVAQLFSFVGIDVAHHQRHIILDKVVEACFFRQYTADHLVGNLDAALLIRTLRITVKHMCPAFAIGVELDGKRIRKFASPILSELTEINSTPFGNFLFPLRELL